MTSVADQLRALHREDARALSPEARDQRVRELGEMGLTAFMAQSGLDRTEAIRELQRRKQAGRSPSACMDALIR